jgi:predicted site-specific integrase-resolvase
MSTKPRSEKFVTVKDAAHSLEVSPNTIRAWGAAGKLPEYRHPVNNYRLFRSSDIDKLRMRIEEPLLAASTEKLHRG